MSRHPGLRGVAKHRGALALILQYRAAQRNLVDPRWLFEFGSNARPILQHLEANRIRSIYVFLVRIDAEIEVIKEQIIIGAIGSVRTNQEIGRRWFLDHGRRSGRLSRL